MELYIKDLKSDEVLNILDDYDEVFSPAISNGLELLSYAEKLSRNGHFVLAQSSEIEGAISGFIAYYLNPNGRYAYIPFIAVKPNYQYLGIGHLMLEHLEKSLGAEYCKIILEVRKKNDIAYNFYISNGYMIAEDRGEKLLMIKMLKRCVENTNGNG